MICDRNVLSIWIHSLYLRIGFAFFRFLVLIGSLSHNLLFLAMLIIFTALHVMQTRYCDEISVRPSVCPSVRLSVCLSHA